MNYFLVAVMWAVCAEESMEPERPDVTAKWASTCCMMFPETEPSLAYNMYMKNY